MKDNSGPAFSVDLEIAGRDSVPGGSASGMSLRDYFAAKAMNGFVSNFGVDFTFGENVKNEIKNLSKLSYCISDAMITEREK